MDKIIITVKVGGKEVERHYAIIDGETPENIREGIQEMVDNLLDNSEF